MGKYDFSIAFWGILALICLYLKIDSLFFIYSGGVFAFISINIDDWLNTRNKR